MSITNTASCYIKFILKLRWNIVHSIDLCTQEYPIGERLLLDFNTFAIKKMNDVNDNHSYISKADNIGWYKW